MEPAGVSKPKPLRTPDAPAPPRDAVAGAPGPDGRSPGKRPREIGGRDGPEPTRYGDWEKDGRAVDF